MCVCVRMCIHLRWAWRLQISVGFLPLPFCVLVSEAASLSGAHWFSQAGWSVSTTAPLGSQALATVPLFCVGAKGLNSGAHA